METIAPGIPFNQWTCEDIAARGSLKMLKFKMSYKGGAQPVQSWMDAATANGNFDVTVWCCDYGFRPTQDAVNKGVENGYVKTTNWLHERGVTCTLKNLNIVFANGHALMLDWLHEHHPDLQITATALGTALCDSKQMPQLLTIVDTWLERTWMDRSFLSSSLFVALVYDNMEVAQSLFDRGVTVDERHVLTNVFCKNYKSIKQLHQLGYKFTQEHLDTAAIGGNSASPMYQLLDEYIRKQSGCVGQ